MTAMKGKHPDQNSHDKGKTPEKLNCRKPLSKHKTDSFIYNITSTESIHKPHISYWQKTISQQV